MRNKLSSHSKFLMMVAVVAAFATGAAVVATAWAGNTSTPPGPPETTTSYSLNDIYNRLDTRAEATPSTFTEPASGPAVTTMHTLDEIYNLLGKRAPVAQTGQVNSHAPGDDGDLEKGVVWPNPRFTDNDDGTVTDNLTGLVWLKDANCTTFFAGDTTGANYRPWQDAVTAANSLASGYCGLTDGSSAGEWRLPNIRELLSLVDYSQSGYALAPNHPFNLAFQNYWSSTTLANVSGSAWTINMYYGRSNYNEKTWDPSVWPVRDAQ